MKKSKFTLFTNFVVLFIVLLTNPSFAVQTILLKQGKTIKGTVSSQNLDHVEVETAEGKHLVIPKKSVLKIVYKDIAEEEELSIRKQEESKREAEKLKLLEERKRELLAKEEANKLETEENKSQGSGVAVKSTIRDSFILGSPNHTQSITLASLDQKCKPYSQYPEYFWMFGAFRFFEPDLTKLLPKESAPLRISQKASLTDIAFTMLGGFLITLTRKTLIIETCEGEGYRLISDKELERIKNSAVSEIKTEHEIETIREKVELELLENDLKEYEKKKKGK